MSAHQNKKRNVQKTEKNQFFGRIIHFGIKPQKNMYISLCLALDVVLNNMFNQ